LASKTGVKLSGEVTALIYDHIEDMTSNSMLLLVIKVRHLFGTQDRNHMAMIREMMAGDEDGVCFCPSQEAELVSFARFRKGLQTPHSAFQAFTQAC
jgi:hypothetical protein